MNKIDISTYKKKKKNIRKKHSEKGAWNSLMDLMNQDISFSEKKLSDRKKEEFYLEISTLLLSGIDLRTAFDLLLTDRKKDKEYTLFKGVRENVIKGSSFSQSLAASTRFSTYEYQSVRIGEETGMLGEVLRELALYYKNRIAQKRKIVSALAYPLIVLCTSFGAVFFMLRFVVPMFAEVFTRFGGELPWITALILRLSHFAGAAALWIVLTALVTIGVLYFNRRKEWYRKWSALFLLRLPIAGEIIRKIHLARFANTMRLLVATDTPLLHAIQLVVQMTDFYPIQQSLTVAQNSIIKGSSLHESLQEFDFYPSKIIQLIRVGEEINKLEFFFGKIADQLTEEIEYKTSTISTVLEPLIIIFLGLVVGIILISMYLPMFQMSSSF